MTNKKLAEMLAVIDAMKANDVLIRKFYAGEQVTEDEYALALTRNHALLGNSDIAIVANALLFVNTLKLDLDESGYTYNLDETTHAYTVTKED